MDANAEKWEEDNRNTRNLQALQAFMIGLDIGLWSGFRRNMEIAESFGQPIVIVFLTSLKINCAIKSSIEANI
jgi:hypothetical protein